MAVLEPDARSYWAPYTTHFSALGRYLGSQHRTAAVLGASDGKFALPLAAAGLRVTAVDLDTVFLFGGEVAQANPPLRVVGLQQFMFDSGLDDRIEIVVSDYVKWADERTFDVVITSGSWSMPQNHHYTLQHLVECTAVRVAPGGLLLVDFISAGPEEEPHSHYPRIEDVRSFFSQRFWEILECVNLGYREESHYDKPEPHSHLFSALIVKRRANVSHAGV